MSPTLGRVNETGTMAILHQMCHLPHAATLLSLTLMYPGASHRKLRHPGAEAYDVYTGPAGGFHFGEPCPVSAAVGNARKMRSEAARARLRSAGRTASRGRGSATARFSRGASRTGRTSAVTTSSSHGRQLLSLRIRLCRCREAQANEILPHYPAHLRETRESESERVQESV